MSGQDGLNDRPVDDANAVIGLLSLLVNVEILGTVREHLAILKQTQASKIQEIELQRVRASNDLRFYETALDRLDDIVSRLPKN